MAKKIPLKYDRFLSVDEIPTENKISVIDNYSPNYNYVIEGDKIYYSKKGLNKWVDISDNDKARNNLYNFIKEKYDFKGYNNGEASILNRVNTGNFNYKSYRDSINNSIDKPIIDTPKVEPVQQVPIVSNEITQEKHKDFSIPFNYDVSKVYNNLAQPVDNTNVVPIKTSGSNADGPVMGVVNRLGELREIAINGIRRKLLKASNESTDPISNLEIPNPVNAESEYGIRPLHYTGDTVKYSSITSKGIPGRYYLPESYDLNSMQLGVRNRYDKEHLETEGGIVTTSFPFLPMEEYDLPNRTYMGVDSLGNFKAGNYKDFGKGDLVSPTYKNRVIDFERNEDGSIRYSRPEEARQGNRKPAPLTRVITEKGDTIQGSLNLITWGNKGDANRYGNLTGGRVVLKAGNETRLASGSIADIEREMQAMKERNKTGYVDVFSNDNGSYNLAFRTLDGKVSTEQQRKYDLLNTGFGDASKYKGKQSGKLYDPYGGNFLYIKNKTKPMEFKSDTLLTPNIRTEKDESFAKGHGLENERKGVVLHHTGFTNPTAKEAIDYMMQPGHGSSHVVIDYDGNRTVMADPKKVTFHAGSSAWKGRDNVNDFMLGIEFQGNTAIKPLTDVQIKSAVEYLEPIIRKNNIQIEDITTHTKVRELYNQYSKAKAPNKIDISESDYIRVLNALKEKVYYKK